MKKVFTLFIGLACTIGVFSQAPEKMSYQAVVRNASGELVKSNPVGIKISILQGSATGTPVFVETQTPNTNANGLITIEIGGGTPVSGTFATIDWSVGSYFVKTEIDPNGGTTYTITVTNQLLSVPYSLYAKTSETSTESIDLKQRIKILEDNLIEAGTYKLSDIEGNQYNVVKIGTQVWMKENLRVTKFNDGTPITYGGNLPTPAYGINIYGAIYNWWASNSVKLCPTGWHVPTLDEWHILGDPYRHTTGGTDGIELIEAGVICWAGVGTNTTGFSAMPDNYSSFLGPDFFNGPDLPHGLSTPYYPIPIYNLHVSDLASLQTMFPVRCLKD